MLYRPPIRVRPSLRRTQVTTQPATVSKKPPVETPKTVDFAKLVEIYEKMPDMLAQIEVAKKELVEASESTIKHATQMRASFEAIKKGPPGLAGKPAKEVDLDEVARRAALLVPKPKDVEPVIIDEKRIAKRAAKYIKVSKIPVAEAVDSDTILQKVVEMLKGGDVKLHVRNLEGFEQTIAPIRSLAAKNGGIRGGGDTVKAGTNVVITTNGSGQKVINVVGAGLAPITVTGTIDDSNKTFNAATQPTLLNINGAFYLQSGGAYTWTYVGTTITLNQPVGLGGSIFGI